VALSSVHPEGDPADETCVMQRKPVPPVVWVLSGATAVSVVLLAAIQLHTYGQHAFFDSGDPRLFFLTAHDLFGDGKGFAAVGRITEIPYRYGRMGLPLSGWLLAFGRPGLVGWTLIGVNLAALIAIPGLAALLLIEYGAPPAAAAFVLVVPDLLFLYGSVVAEPLLIALLLLAFVLDARGYRRSTICVIAFAILVKEIALLALVPLAWRAVRQRDWRGAAAVAAAVLPYAAWCVWVRSQLGEFPFLTDTRARRGALGLPFAGIHHTLVDRPLAGTTILAMVLATILLCAAGAWLGRGTPIAGLAALFGLVTICLGPEALKFVGETFRVLLVPEVFGLLALIIGLRGHHPRAIGVTDTLQNLEAQRV
jgi:hypothetical protein